MSVSVDDIVVASPPIAAEPIRDREWWAAEAGRAGTDWLGVVRTAIGMLTMAGVIGPEPSAFHQACEQADRRRQHRRAAPPHNRPVPKVMVDALTFSLRRGVNELVKPDTQRRLSALDADQLEAVCLRVQAFQPATAAAWSAQDADLLISAWRKLREQR
jgi:hypothetical protein